MWLRAVKHEIPEVGCFLSHIMALCRAYNAGHELFCIMEDDACFNYKYESNSDACHEYKCLIDTVEERDTIAQHITEHLLLKDEWDILFLGATSIMDIENTITGNFINKHETILQIDGADILGTHAVIYTRDAARYILDTMEEFALKVILKLKNANKHELLTDFINGRNYRQLCEEYDFKFPSTFSEGKISNVDYFAIFTAMPSNAYDTYISRLPLRKQIVYPFYSIQFDNTESDINPDRVGFQYGLTEMVVKGLFNSDIKKALGCMSNVS